MKKLEVSEKVGLGCCLPFVLCGALLMSYAAREGSLYDDSVESASSREKRLRAREAHEAPPEVFLKNCGRAVGQPLNTNPHADGSFRIHWSNEADGLVVTDEVFSCGFVGWKSGRVRWARRGTPR
jgi:hypothetical protein